MNKGYICTSSYGIKAPIIKEGDDLVNIIVKSVLDATYIDSTYNIVKNDSIKEGFETQVVKNYDLDDRDIIGITESVIARAQGNYVTVDEVAENIKALAGDVKKIIIVNPIYSRNRFSLILKAIARAASESIAIYMPEFDEVGNPSGVNPFTGVDIKAYYKELVEKEGKNCYFREEDRSHYDNENNAIEIYCGLHDYKEWKEKYGDERHITLADICSDKCEYGLLGSNKATDEKLKLFPNKVKAEKLLYEVQKRILEKTGKLVYVASYGDGCFKDAVGGIWEFADPVTMPAYTNPDVFESRPNEIKIKAFADDQYRDLSGNKLINAIKDSIKSKDDMLIGKMASQGTTPRIVRDLVASLMDLTSGSGDKGTPIVLVKGYFNNYAK